MMNTPAPRYYPQSNEQKNASERRLKWFQKAQYGMFLHWGLYSLPAGIWRGRESYTHYTEWLQHHERISAVDWAKLAREFNPVSFDANEWVQTIQDAGMSYLTLTAKHHEGFAMFHSKASSFNIVDATPFARDPIEELADACSTHGIQLCLYYSQCLDWSHPDAFEEGPRFHPEKQREGYQPDHDRYVEEKVLPQLTELLTQYGQIGAIWFDTPFYNEEKLSRSWGKRISDHVRNLNDEVLISSRVVDTSLHMRPLNPDLYDFLSLPDLHVHEEAREMFAESPDSICRSYGYDRRKGTTLMSADTILERLRMMNRHNGNLLLNLGPTGEGRLPPSAVQRLLEVQKRR